MSRPASAPRALARLTAMELRLAARRGESLLVTLVVPPAVLVFFASIGLPGLPDRPVDFLLPGTLALAIVASGLVSLGIATGFERSYGVLKRLGGAPVARWVVVAAKLLGVLAVVGLQAAVLVGIAVVGLAWAPAPGWSPAPALIAALLGTVAFAGLGLALASILRAEATLAVANGLLLAFLMLGGVVVPVAALPAALQPLASLLPVTALADLLRVAFGGPSDPAGPAVLLVAWAVAGAAAAVRSFRWE